jgi:hypothetical protein
MKKTILSTIALSMIGISTANASDISAKFVNYENGSGSEYSASLDVKYNFSIEGSYSILNLEEFTLLNASKGEDQNPDVKIQSIGIGYTFPISYELEVYAKAFKTTLKTEGLVFLIQSTSEGAEPIEIESEIEEIKGKEFEAGFAYKFANYFEIDLAAKHIQYDNDISEKVTAGIAGLSVYINPNLKVTASYASDSFLEEENYGIGVTYKF